MRTGTDSASGVGIGLGLGLGSRPRSRISASELRERHYPRARLAARSQMRASLKIRTRSPSRCLSLTL